MGTNRLLILILLFLAIAPAVMGVGLRPAEVQEVFEPGLSKYINLKVQNPEGKDMKITAYAKGDLAGYISFPQQIMDVSGDEKEAVFSYRIELPESIQTQGQLITQIILVAIPEKGHGDTVVSANIELVSTLKVIVPYDKKYIEAKIFVPKMEFGKESNIVVDMKNHGKENVQSAIAVIDIYNSMNQKVMVLRSEDVPLDSLEKKSIIIPYVPALDNGLYKAKLTVIYDGQKAVDEKMFTIGNMEVLINYISVDAFTLGGIAKFNIILESLWNQPINDLYGLVSVIGQDGKTYTSYKSANTDIEAFGKQTIEAFWSTDKVGTGKYKLKVDLFYMDKETKYETEITVTPDEIRVAGITGRMVDAGGDKSTNALLLNNQMLLIVIVLLLAIFMGMYAYKSFWKKK